MTDGGSLSWEKVKVVRGHVPADREAADGTDEQARARSVIHTRGGDMSQTYKGAAVFVGQEACSYPNVVSGALRQASCQKATAEAAATLRESTPWDIGMRTV